MVVEDNDMGFALILKNLKKLDGAYITAGVHGDQGSHMVYIANLHEFGSQPWMVGTKQAYFMARYLMGLDPDAADKDAKAHFWAVYWKLVGKVMQIPERSYIRSTFDTHQATFQKAADRVLDAVLVGEDADHVLKEFALFVQTMFRRGLLAVKNPVNAPLTIALKGSAQPLVADGRLRMSIVAVVRRGGGSD
jgi:hypothetical protein